MSGEQGKHSANGSSTINLDLSGVSDPEQLASSIETFYKADSTNKSQLSKQWQKNQYFLDGIQWIMWESSSQNGIWKPVKVSSENEYIPRPVTNYIFDCYQTLKGYLLKTTPRISVRPNSTSSRDKTAAKLATLVSETNDERLREPENYEYAASCLVTYGTVFKKSYWDTSSVTQVKIPRMEQQPQIDPMSGQVIGMQEVPVIDPNSGEPIEDLVPLGDVNSDVVEPYRMALDPLANDLHKARWLMEYSIQAVDWVKEVYGNPNLQGAIPENVAELEPDMTLNGSMSRFMQLKTSSGTRNMGFSGASSMSSSGVETELDNTTVLKEYYERPSATNPKGRLIVVASGKTLYIGEPQMEGPDLDDWHPYSECRWEIVPGRFWGRSPLDDATDTNKVINSIDSTIILTRKTMAIPQKLLPLGIGVTPGQWNGRPGLEIPYRNDGSGAKPETIPAAGVHASVFTEREMRLNDLKQVSGAIDILKGDRPPGVTAASALSMLYEVGTGKLFPMLNRYKRFYESDKKKQLRLISKYYKEPREDFIRMLRMRNRDLSEEELNKFIGSDLYDNCNVIIEAGSNIPKLQAAEQALLMEVAATGALALNIPANRSEFLQRLGITGFDSDVGPDTKRAEWENDLLDSLAYSPDNKPIWLVTDNNVIHEEIHGKRTKEPSFMSLPPQVQQAYFAHIEEHKNAEAQAQQMQMMQSMMMAQGGMKPGAPAPQQGLQSPEIKTRQSGNGLGAHMKEALFSDSLVPGQSKPSRGPGIGQG